MPTWRKGIEFEELNPKLPEDELKLRKSESCSSSEVESVDLDNTVELFPETENDVKCDWPISPVKK